MIIFAVALAAAGKLPASERQAAPQTGAAAFPQQDGHYLVATACVARPITVLPGVYFGAWEDTAALCAALDVQPGAEVLDIGTGNGVLALAALERGARRAVATDINPEAVENARLNASLRALSARLDARLVPSDSPEAYSVIAGGERFDLIICNCPAFDADAASYDQANAFDPGHRLVISLLHGLKAHLKPGGRLLMTYWSGAGMALLRRLAEENALQLKLITPQPHDPPPGVAQDIDRAALYRIPFDKVKDRLTGHEATVIVEVTPLAE